MIQFVRVLFSISLIFALIIGISTCATKVTVKGKEILLDGEPFKIKGVGLNNVIQFDLLKSMGANTVRTYGGDETAAVLEAAQQNGLKVIAGLWIRPTYQGLDYNNATAVDEELAVAVTPFIKRYKNHPALLFWGVGNEMELNADSSQWNKIWAVIEKAAKLVHQLDPNHPTMAVLAEVADGKAASFRSVVKSIDILGVNSYGPETTTVQERVRAQKWTGPLLITEFGPIGQWQVELTSWGAAPEPSSDQKAEMLKKQLETLKSQNQDALPFYWGNKFESTFTWHGLLLPAPGREYLRTSEVIAESWGGKVPNKAPRLQANWTNTANPWNTIEKGKNATIKLVVSDPEKNKVSLNFTVAAETDTVNGGAATTTFPSNTVTVINGNTAVLVTKALDVGNYRVYVTAKDGKGAAATANLPFQVKKKK